MKSEKLTEAVASAADNIEEAIKALIEKDEKNTLWCVWRAAASSEYALFLFSIDSNASPENSQPWKLSPNPKNMEVGPVLAIAQELLKEAEGNIRTGNLQEAHKKTWMARGYLSEVQVTFEKRHKDDEKSPPSHL